MLLQKDIIIDAIVYTHLPLLMFQGGQMPLMLLCKLMPLMMLQTGHMPLMLLQKRWMPLMMS